MKYIKTVNLEIDKHKYDTIIAKQNDTSRYLLFKILNNGVPFSLAGKTVRAYGKKPDGKEVFNNLTVVNAEGGLTELRLTTQVLAMPGWANLELRIYEGTDILSTLPFVLDIIKSTCDDAIESTNEFSALTLALADLAEWDKYFEETSGRIEEKYTPRLNELSSQMEQVVQINHNSTNPLYNLLKKDSTSNFYGRKLIYILGDSISFGYNVIDRTKDSYLAILRNMLNIELDSTNIGFEGIAVNPTMVNYHNITRTGTWTLRNTDTNMGLQVMESSESGATLTFTVNTKQKIARVVYDVIPNGGSFDIEINGVNKLRVNTNGSYISDMNSLPISNINLKTIKIIKLDNQPISIGGVIYANDESKINYNPIVKSGHSLINTSNVLLARACEGSILFMCLGHNDRGLNISDFTTKINLIIQKCNENKTFVVVNDFIWTDTQNDMLFKNELKRLANETNGTYIRFDEYLGNTSAKLKAIGFFEGSDYSHPTVHGHKMLAEIDGRVLGLSTSSKYLTQNLINDRIKTEYNDWVILKPTDLTSPFTPSNVEEKYSCRYKNINGIVCININVNTNSAGNNSVIFTLPLECRPFANVSFYVQNSPLTKNVNQITIEENGNVRWTPTENVFSNIRATVCFSVL